MESDLRAVSNPFLLGDGVLNDKTLVFGLPIGPLTTARVETNDGGYIMEASHHTMVDGAIDVPSVHRPGNITVAIDPVALVRTISLQPPQPFPPSSDHPTGPD